MGRLLRRNIWIEAGISLFLMLFFIYFYCHIDQWVIETLPSTISPAFFPSVVTLVLIIMSALLTGFCLRGTFRAKQRAQGVQHIVQGEEDALEADAENIAFQFGAFGNVPIGQHGAHGVRNVLVGGEKMAVGLAGFLSHGVTVTGGPVVRGENGKGRGNGFPLPLSLLMVPQGSVDLALDLLGGRMFNAEHSRSDMQDWLASIIRFHAGDAYSQDKTEELLGLVTGAFLEKVERPIPEYR